VGNSRQAFWSRCPHLGDFLEGQQLQRDRSTKSQQSLMVSTNSELSHKICYDLTNDPGRPWEIANSRSPPQSSYAPGNKEGASPHKVGPESWK